MSTSPQPPVPPDGSTGVSLEGALAQAISRFIAWVFGRDSTVVVLLIALGVLCYGIRWVSMEVVPTHIKSVRETLVELERTHREERERTNAEWREAVTALTESHQKSAAEAHQQTQRMIDQIERLVVGRKPNPSPKPEGAEQ
jgi:hypothetical protein